MSTPSLFVSIRRNDVEALQADIEAMRRDGTLDAALREVGAGTTPLGPLSTACWADFSLVTLLVESGAPLDVLPGERLSPLQAAAMVGDARTFRFLLDRGAKLEGYGSHKEHPAFLAISHFYLDGNTRGAWDILRACFESGLLPHEILHGGESCFCVLLRSFESCRARAGGVREEQKAMFRETIEVMVEHGLDLDAPMEMEDGRGVFFFHNIDGDWLPFRELVLAATVNRNRQEMSAALAGGQEKPRTRM